MISLFDEVPRSLEILARAAFLVECTATDRQPTGAFCIFTQINLVNTDVTILLLIVSHNLLYFVLS
jgi:hypothetical protein